MNQNCIFSNQNEVDELIDVIKTCHTLGILEANLQVLLDEREIQYTCHTVIKDLIDYLKNDIGYTVN